MAIKSDMWNNDINLLACWFVLDEAPFELAPFGSALEDSLDCKNDFGLVLLGVVDFELVVLVPFVWFWHDSSSLHMNISSQCSSFNTASYVTQRAGPYFKLNKIK